LAMKYMERKLLLRRLRINRIAPQELAEMLERGEPVTVIDLRHPAEIEREGHKVPGALVLRPDELRSRSGEIPRDQRIILYCT
ncbi:MAG: hypothetical protein JO211_04750, partial [Acidobacteriaceae bacterium]|nr:hypothetical protein [Acidobacteriaceae bacterium]